jgi:NAD(P)-dependent dehydrogenase (short-subunit alcohol dehydrogenase family)
MRELNGKNAVVTGGGSGIGLATADALARRGVNLGLIDIDADALERARAQLAESGVAVHIRALDVGSRPEVYAAARELNAALGDVHILFSNAGVADGGSPLEEASDQSFDWLMNVNVFGMFNVIKAFVPAMKAHGGPAHVVLTASIVALHEQPGRAFGVYAAGKMAVLGFADALRTGLAGRVGVSVLLPGAVATNLRAAGRHRPDRFGGPFARPDAAGVHGGITPAEVARIVVRAIEDDTFFVVTHPAGRGYLDARYRELSAAFDHWSALLPTIGIDPAAPFPGG